MSKLHHLNNRLEKIINNIIKQGNLYMYKKAA